MRSIKLFEEFLESGVVRRRNPDVAVTSCSQAIANITSVITASMLIVHS
ncbi:hypothetical protein HQ545_03435 [Candidatus Woesearchaeota archaeon]|nr:hypothetical protein [Candidatus Woesearchaeota archaeon]